ncbi:NAD(P)-dependent oxidoreductase [Cupriavidus alkaliphilus]|uniref:NAD(P)-dependent oxidoreductase n=1 Tax=Cupriavidus alkaliphilus TaxID=942866 RepID=UPI001613D7C8|nr:NAD(P)-dependent oxidoreductase [Cupriavidus alkaliphilus]MBB3014053.1 3-hydroxyisobutyrate dehydrogenase [Cupriavidus alkaliphilus]
MKVGFIGLGTMGSGMALNLCKATHEVIVHDIRKESAAPHLAAGATWADSVAEVGSVADLVFTSLPGPKEMQQVGLGEGGLIGSMRSGSVWLDLTTNSPRVVREVHLRLREKGVALLDVPVSGGPAGARSGKLAIYVGGEADAFERCKPLLDAIGDQVIHVGEIGAGNTAKLVHNLASLVTRVAIAEVFTLGVKAGVEPTELWHAIRQGAIGRSRTFDRLAEHYLEGRYDPPSFALRLAHKDFTLGLELAEELSVPMKCAEAAYADFNLALERGWGDRDSRSPMELQNERAGVSIKLSREDVKRTLARG